MADTMMANPIRVLLGLGLLVGRLSLIEGGATEATGTGRTGVVGSIVEMSLCKTDFVT
jgi:hypothetical protein